MRQDSYPGRIIQEAQTADFNLEALSFKELKQLQKDLAKAIFTFEDRQKAEDQVKGCGFGFAEVQSRLARPLDQWEPVLRLDTITTEARIHITALTAAGGGTATV